MKEIKGSQMKAIQYTSYGSPEVLKLVEIEKPVPKENEILVKIIATTVTTTECTFRKGEPYFSRLFTGISKPKNTILGEELAGIVESIGKNVTLFKVGDEIFGTAGPNFGANVEYFCMSENGVIIKKPENLTFEESASSIDGFLTAMPFLRDTGKIQKGQKVLINGASGSIGSSAVQIAKYFGAEVTGVCSSSNLELVKSLGADFVIDYTKEDFTKFDKKYDLIFDTVGKISFSSSKSSLTKNGIFLEAGIGLSVMLHVLTTSIFGNKKAKFAATGLRPEKERIKDLHILKELLEKGIIKPVIDRTFPFEQIVEAHKYVDKGHKKGNVAISMQSN